MGDAQHRDGEERAAQAQDRIGDGRREHTAGDRPDGEAKRQRGRRWQAGEAFLQQAGGERADADEGASGRNCA